MARRSHLLIFGLTILFSSIFPICHSSYFLKEHEIRSENDDLNPQELANYDKVIIERIKNSHQAQSKALISSLSSSKIVNVEHFVRSRKIKDDTKAFNEAWKEVCSMKNGGVFLVPRNKRYIVKPINFTGPCHSRLITIKIEGTIEASTNMSDYYDRYHWLLFQNLRNFKVEGKGTIDGRGQIWWQNSCKVNKTKPCLHAPTALIFLECKNFIVDGIHIKNPQQMHISFQYSSDVRASNLFLKAPGNSPNTDGFNINATTNIHVTKSSVSTGDDCVSIVNESKDVHVSDLICGPGHGISIGSLGKNHSKPDHVSNVLINHVKISGTTNGGRIKTWQGGRGYAKKIVFQNIELHNVSNPIIIDQYYCDQKTPCPEQKEAVRVSNIVYKNIRGTSFTEPAINLNCSKTHHCRSILMQNINILKEEVKEPATADCQNIQIFNTGKVSPKCFQAS
ncbi:unnamed protein product [Amaranthus hypochondriacus]